MEELNKKELEKAAGGMREVLPHCPKCRSKDLGLVAPVDIGTLQTYRCKACGYEWRLAL